MSPSSTYDAPHRRESATKAKGIQPLMTRSPLPLERDKKPPAPPKKNRKPRTPTTDPFSFHPRDNAIPPGRQYPPVSPLKPSADAPEHFNSYSEPQTSPLPNREIHTPIGEGCDMSRWPHAGLEPVTEHTAWAYSAPYADVNTMGVGLSDAQDSPVSSSSSPDQSPYPPEIAASPLDTRQVQPPMPVRPYNDQGNGVYQGSCGYSTDDHLVSMQYYDYSRLGAHGASTFSGSNGYTCPRRS